MSFNVWLLFCIRPWVIVFFLKSWFLKLEFHHKFIHEQVADVSKCLQVPSRDSQEPSTWFKWGTHRRYFLYSCTVSCQSCIHRQYHCKHQNGLNRARNFANVIQLKFMRNYAPFFSAISVFNLVPKSCIPVRCSGTNRIHRFIITKSQSSSPAASTGSELQDQPGVADQFHHQWGHLRSGAAGVS